MKVAKKYVGGMDDSLLESAIRNQAKLAYVGIDCDSWRKTAEGLVSINLITSVPKCEDIAAPDIAPKDFPPSH